jgi:phosphoglycerol transferase MdoB-like AlkP superfamily enzyme
MLSKIKKGYHFIGTKLCAFCNYFKKFRIFHSNFFQVYFLSIITTLIIELLSKKSLIKLVTWLIKSPVVFLTNVLIVGIVYGFCVCFKHKYFFYAVTASLWIVIGITNCIVTASRVTPFTFGDIKTLPTVFSVIFKYITYLQFGLIIIGLVILVALLVNGYFHIPVIGGNFKYSVSITQAIAMMAVNFIFVSTAMRIGIMSVNFVNLRNAYQDYGVAYCFSNSVVNTGINKPKDYSKEKVDEILSTIATDGNATAVAGNEEPNVIFVQLESFFNVDRLEHVEYTEDPIPTMTYLYENYDTGLLSVPSISAGTANTEFEILTGMNMDDFGPGEYPFNTILSKDITSESIANDLKEYGYSTHGIHNNVATFYSRRIVYPNLGIDNFTSLEYMTGVEVNALGWAKDSVLTKYVNEALDSTEGADFIFTVSVQGHGAYPEDDELENPSLLVSTDGFKGDVNYNAYAYYLEQLNEMDQFVAELIETLENRDEDTMLVLYGDHLPGFDITQEDLSTGTLYDTEYVIWTNFDIGKRQEKDMEAYELGSYVMDLLGYDAGLITKLHQNKSAMSEEDYLDALQTLEYDMLYGDKNCWNGISPYTSNEIKYGYDEIKISNVVMIADTKNEGSYYLLVNGENFTEYSQIYLEDDTKLDSIYVNENTLFVPEIQLSVGDRLSIHQESGTTTLGISGDYYLTDKDMNNEFKYGDLMED